MPHNIAKYPAPEKLRSILDYDEETGALTWRVSQSNSIKVGSRAGGLHRGTGYVQIAINRQKLMAHRVIWTLVYSYTPEYIDHINLIKSDNRLSNLRAATAAENNANQAKRLIGSSSRFKGVTWHKQCGKWQAAIKVAGKNYHLGLFEDETAAHLAYCEAARSAYGEFMRAA